MGWGTCHFSGVGRAPGWGSLEEGVSALRRSPMPPSSPGVSPPPRRWGWSRSRPQTRRPPAAGGRRRRRGRGRWACSGGQSTEALGSAGQGGGPAPPPGLTHPAGPTVPPPHCRTLRTRWTWASLTQWTEPPAHTHKTAAEMWGGGGSSKVKPQTAEDRRAPPAQGDRVGGGHASAGAGGQSGWGPCLSWGWGSGESLPASILPVVCRGPACKRWPSTCV